MQTRQIGLILLLLLLVFGLVTQSIPFTNDQFISQSTDLNYILFQEGYYDGNFLTIDGNKLSVSVIDFDDEEIPWSSLIDFPSGCSDNQAVKIVGSSLVCVDLPTDTNYQTAGFDFGDYVLYSGATGNVDLGSNDLTTNELNIGSVNLSDSFGTLEVSDNFYILGDWFDAVNGYFSGNLEVVGFLDVAGDISGDNFSGSSSGVNTGDQDLSPYWKSDGTSTATGNWDLGSYNLTTNGSFLNSDSVGFDIDTLNLFGMDFPMISSNPSTFGLFVKDILSVVAIDSENAGINLANADYSKYGSILFNPTTEDFTFESTGISVFKNAIKVENSLPSYNRDVIITAPTQYNQPAVMSFGDNTDGLQIDGDVNLGSNDLSVNRINIGTNTQSGLSDGDINASTIYYDVLTAKSPIILCSEDWCSVDLPQAKEGYYLRKDSNWNVLEITDNSGKTIESKEFVWENDFIVGSVKLNLREVLDKTFKLRDKTICLNNGFSWDGDCFELVKKLVTYNLAVEKVPVYETITNDINYPCVKLNANLVKYNTTCTRQKEIVNDKKILDYSFEFRENCGWKEEIGYYCIQKQAR